MPKILVVDDDIDYLTQQKVQLEAEGYEVVTAESVEQGAEIARQEKPDAAIVDLMMQNVDDGFTLCFQLKKMDPNLPVIMVTAVSSETGLEFDAVTDEERSWVKADAVMAKPVRFEQLKGELNRLLAGSRE